MKIGFITDTNILKETEKNLNEKNTFLNNVNFFVEYIESLKKTGTNKELIYFMPEIIIEELYYQKLRSFNARYEKFCENYEKLKYGLDGEIPKINIDKVLNDEKERYVEKYEIIKLDYKEEIFKELVEDALRKKPPFDKTQEGMKSDAGYKDALIWKSILYSEKIDECQKIYLISSDRIFVDNESELSEEFKKHHSNTELCIRYFEPDGQRRQNSLKCIITENKLFETEIVKLYDNELILNNIHRIKYNLEEEICFLENEEKLVLKNINFREFEREDFSIENVEKIENKFNAIVDIDTTKYVLEDEKTNLKPLLGTIIFTFEKKRDKFELVEYKIKNIRFYISPIGLFVNNIADVIKEMYSESTKKTIENISKTLTDNIKYFKEFTDAAAFKSALNSLKYINPRIEALNEIKEKDENGEEE